MKNFIWIISIIITDAVLGYITMVSWNYMFKSMFNTILKFGEINHTLTDIIYWEAMLFVLLVNVVAVIITIKSYKK